MAEQRPDLIHEECLKRMSFTTTEALYKDLEGLYKKVNRYQFIAPDPLCFVYRYSTALDREVAGLIASAIAYGRVGQIRKSLDVIFERIGCPGDYISGGSFVRFRRDFLDFKHRFTTGEDVASLLLALKRAIETFGSLKDFFRRGVKEEDETYLPALQSFLRGLRIFSENRSGFLLPDPDKGSAFKRLNLFLRWMVRCDDVDPGVWRDLSCSKLIVPLDTHMYKIGYDLGLTKRRQADLVTALDITESFRKINPNDPVRYDFSLIQLSIQNSVLLDQFIAQAKKKAA